MIVTNIDELRRKSTDINLPEEMNRALSIASDLKLELKSLKKPCLGLCAPQIDILKRVVVLNRLGQQIVIINPVIKKRSNQMSSYPEGCFSVPNTIGGGREIRITRPKQIKLEYTKDTGERVLEKFNGILCRAIQHEIDHLNGILIIDYK
jgi:peptide deformylase